jgi:tetratricopeptide (TPR) repeat protein
VPRGFVGRTAEIEKLHATLRPGTPVPIPEQPRVALVGMPGVGKTQLAAYYAWHHVKSYKTVCWVDAAGGDITAKIASLAHKPLALGRPAYEPVADTAEAVSQALSKRGPHLLIFDNVDDPESFHKHIPPSAETRVLVTSRRSDIQGVATLLLGLLPRPESIALLTNGAKLDDTEVQAANRLCDAVGSLTLALAIASRILHRPGGRPSKLLRKVHAAAPLGWSDGAPRDHLWQTHPNLTRLLDASVDLLDRTHPVDAQALNTLKVGGWFAPVAIPAHLLEDAAARLSGLSPDYATAEEAHVRLIELGMAEGEVDGTLTFHPVVAACSRLMGGEAAKKAMVDTMAELARRTRSDILAVLELRAVSSHLEAAADHLGDGSPLSHWLIALRLVQYYKHTAQYERAIDRCERVVVSLGESPVSADFYFERAKAASRKRGQYESSLSDLIRALAIRESSGPDTAEVATIHHAIGQTLTNLGKMADAANHYTRSLAIKTNLYGLKHLETAVTLNAIGQLLGKQGKASHALTYLESALGIKKEVLGPNHPEIAITLSSMGQVFEMVGRYDEAVDCFRESLTIKEKSFDPEHPEIGITLTSLAKVTLVLGNPVEALEQAERAIQILERRLNREHPFAQLAYQVAQEARACLPERRTL